MRPYEKRVLLPEDLQPLTSLSQYQERGGGKGLARARTMHPEEIINLVKQAGLRGRGGAGFPAGIKWETVYNATDEKKYVVCNAAEGEPGTYKDRYFLSKNPYQLIEGILIISHVVNAREAIIGTKKKYKPQVDRIVGAITEFEEAGLVPRGYVRVVLGPDDYLLGEEKALLEVIDGRGAMPRYYPPFMVGVGYSTWEQNPTVVNNAETMCHVANILREGADWFRSMGSEDTPGTGILTLSGDIKTPGMFEVELGKLTVREMLYELGGGPLDGREFKAVFSGVANRVMTPDQFNLKMDFGTLRSNGVGLGSGGFMVYDDSRDIVDITLMLSEFLAKESCGQCVPCNNGLRRITEYLERLATGQGTERDLMEIKDVCGWCTKQTRCFLPTQESVLVSSCLEKFEPEFRAHIGVEAHRAEDLILPKLHYFDEEKGQFIYESEVEQAYQRGIVSQI